MRNAVVNLDRLNVKSDMELGTDRENEGALEKELPRAFVGQTMNECLAEAMTLEVPNMLFGEFIFEEELTIIYTKPNVGKSMLALQIANAITQGDSIMGLVNEADPQPVIYYDLELSQMQLLARYSEKYKDSEGKRKYKEPYRFNDALHRFKFGNDSIPKDWDRSEFLFENIKRDCEEINAKVVVIDNISWLSMKGLEKMEDAKKLLRMLLDLCDKHKYTVIVIAHTPKIDNRPIYLTDLAGSGGIGAFADACFVINDSPVLGKPHKYLKQNKCRSAEKIYDEGNVLNATMEKIEGNFIGFRLTEEVDEELLIESNHFKRAEILTTARYNEDQKIEAKLKIKKAIEEDPSLSSRQLEKISGVRHTTALKYRKEVEANPQLFDGYMNPKAEEDGDS